MNTPANAPATTHNAGPPPMTRYQMVVVAILAFLQFTIILDFMILSPLGAMLLDELDIDTSQFGLVVSAYAFSAGASGFLTAGFADKFDRKRLLLFFYVGFIGGTVLCGVAPTYETLLGARVVTGIFGGVIGSISMAIIADLFPLAMRGRVMGTVQTAFAASQVLGLPLGLALSNLWGWHAPFLLIAGIGAVVGVVIAVVLRPIDEHLKTPRQGNAFAHMFRTATKPAYLRGFAATILLATGGFMIAPFSTAFLVNNLGVPLTSLPVIYVVTGVFAIFMGPLAGRLADSVGKLPVFVAGSLAGTAVVIWWVNLEGPTPTPMWVVIVVNVLMFGAITARMISAGALTSAVPALQDRGAYMSISSSLQQLSGGVAAGVGGLIVSVGANGKLERFDLLGYVVCAAMIITLLPMWVINKQVQGQTRR
ncbi:MAG: MFS transporter [Deltaproteobacteria bacterium]|nr:MFS transporter [Deltaproteobacteria bacterium]